MVTSQRVEVIYVPEVDLLRIDLPGAGHRVSVLLPPEQGLRLLTALKIALAVKAGPPKRKVSHQ